MSKWKKMDSHYLELINNLVEGKARKDLKIFCIKYKPIFYNSRVTILYSAMRSLTFRELKNKCWKNLQNQIRMVETTL